MTARFAEGDRATVTPRAKDPMLIHYHRHVVVAEVLHGGGGPGYIVGHPGMPGRYGPYAESDLVEGWQHTHT